MPPFLEKQDSVSWSPQSSHWTHLSCHHWSIRVVRYSSRMGLEHFAQYLSFVNIVSVLMDNWEMKGKAQRAAPRAVNALLYIQQNESCRRSQKRVVFTWILDDQGSPGGSRAGKNGEKLKKSEADNLNLITLHCQKCQSIDSFKSHT